MINWVRRMVIGALAGCFLLCAGCDRNDSTATPSERGPISESLHNGQPIGEVIDLLGTPMGRGAVSGVENLFYSGGMLKFRDGVLTNLTPDLERKILRGTRPEKHSKRSSRWFSFDFSDKKHREYLSEGKITVVVFYAGWETMERQGIPSVEKTARQIGGVVVRLVKIDSWESPLASEFSLGCLPNIRVFNAKGRMVGAPVKKLEAVEKRIQKAQGAFASFDQVADTKHRSLLSEGSVTLVYFAPSWAKEPSALQHWRDVSSLVEGRNVAVRRVEFRDCRSPNFRKYEVDRLPCVRVFDQEGVMVGDTVYMPKEIERLLNRAGK